MREAPFQPVPPNRNVPKKRRHRLRNTIIGAIVLCAIVGLFNQITGRSTTDGSASSAAASTRTDPSASSGSGSHTGPVVVADWDTSGCLFLDDDILYEYGSYLTGEQVVTVIRIDSLDRDMLKSQTEGNDSFFFSVTCAFPEEDALRGLHEDDLVTVAGTIEENVIHSGTVEMTDCRLIGLGEIAEELQANTEEQRALCEERKQAHEQAQAEAAAEERQAWVDSCETVSYRDVERNPDTYKDRRVRVSGKVSQVSEGWFDTVTLRLTTSDGDWAITYARSEGESRILEGDRITAYGECTGVSSYTNVLGSQVTVPSMTMKYYD